MFVIFRISFLFRITKIGIFILGAFLKLPYDYLRFQLVDLKKLPVEKIVPFPFNCLWVFQHSNLRG